MRYVVIYADGASTLQDLVNDAIADGWRPLGGVAIHGTEQRVYSGGFVPAVWMWAQAMTRDENS